MSGWIKLHRSLTDWEWYHNSDIKSLFIHLVLTANHKDGKWQGNEVKMGQVITGRKALSEQTGISQQKVRTCLKRLKNSEEITVKSTSKFSIITILNYAKYQGPESKANQQLTSNQPATNQQSTTNKNDKKEKKDKKTTTTQKIKELKPESWTIEEWRELYLHRKNRNASQTVRAYQLLLIQFEIANKAGVTAEQILNAMSTGKGWAGFRYEWMQNQTKKLNGGHQNGKSIGYIEPSKRTAEDWAS